MKKIIIPILIILITIMSLGYLGGCVEKTEYDNKEIVSIHYYTTECFLPWQNHKYYNFNEMTYSTKHIIEEGYENLYSANYENKEYTVKTTFNEKQMKVFFNNIKKHGIFNFDKNYHNNDVLDGNSWYLTITFSDGTTFESGGYMKYPKSAKVIDNDFLKFSGYKLFDLYEY